MVSLTGIAGLMVMLWKFGLTSHDPASVPDESRPRASLGPGEQSGGAGGFSSADGTDANVEPGRLSPTARTAIVAARLRAWTDDDDPELRDQRTQKLETLLGPGGPGEIADRLKTIEALPADLMNFAFGLPSFQQWMSSDPRAAADWMSSHPGISEARLLTLLQNWRQQNRDELRLYLGGLPEGGWKQKVVVAASYAALPDDPVEAITWARQMHPGGPQTGLLDLATVEWAKSDPAAAAHWVGRAFDPALRELLISSLAIGFADTDADLAAEWVMAAVRPGAVLDRSVAEIARAWAKCDPTAAGAWVAQVPAGEGRNMALGHLLNIWGNHDRAAAMAWIQALSDEALRTQAVELLGAYE
jgi:hypothetical protein